MHAVVLNVTVNDADAAPAVLRDQVVPQVSGTPGFVAGYLVRECRCRRCQPQRSHGVGDCRAGAQSEPGYASPPIGSSTCLIPADPSITV